MFSSKKNLKKEIKFWAISDDIGSLCPPPYPAKNSIPEWYRKMDKFIGNNNKLEVYDNGAPNVSLKGCMSFLDTLVSGYIITLHCDILVKQNEDKTYSMSWSSVEKPLSPRALDLVKEIPLVPGFGAFLQAWELKYSMILPKGYTALITQPLNRYDLPFYASSGFLDADSPVGPGGIPFAIKDGFEGIIPAGTPILQIIPMKRESWKMSIAKAPFPQLWNASPRNKLFGWYKNEIWKKKDFS